MIRNLAVVILEPGFAEHDIWFLNNQARWYLENAEPQFGHYSPNVASVRELFELVPEDLRPKLKWPGPEPVSG